MAPERRAEAYELETAAEESHDVKNEYGKKCIFL
jgi:hypothetical protein